MNEENYLPTEQEQEQQILRESYLKNIGQQFGSPSMFPTEKNDNLIKWQLDIKDELTRIEHLLRKHIPKTDKEGNTYYEESPEANQLFNERGVNEILNILAWYLNKNIILSNFSEKDIRQRIDQFARYLTDFIFMNYQSFGLDTLDKMKHYPMIVMNIINVVEATYFRALNGGERREISTSRHVMQTEPLGMNQGYNQNQNQQQNKFSIFSPSTWIKK